MTQQTYDANDVLMGGGGGAAWKFEQPITRTGTILSPPQAKQEREYDKDNPGGGAPKFFPSGDPIMGVVVEVQSDDERTGPDDDGKRTFYIEGRYLKDAVREGVRNSGAKGLEVGGKLSVEFTHREDPMDKRSRKFWKVDYTPAGNVALMGGDAPAAQPAPVTQAAPAFAAAPATPGLPPGMTQEQFAAFQAYQQSQAS